MNQARYPDIEIYLKRVDTEQILAWLRQAVGEFEISKREPSIQIQFGDMACTIAENVAKGGYVSVWFKPNKTPWSTDRECALAAFAEFQVEIRCSTGGWEGEDDGGWLRITEKGEQVVNWHQS